MTPLVSVIIPTYNRSTTIERAVDSILVQTYQNFEIILVDDGSTDETLTVLSRYTDSRLRIFKHNINRRAAAAINTGLNNVKGEWFTLLGSDDEITPSALETLVKVPLEKDESVTAVSCNCMDSSTEEFSGKGLNSDQYVDDKTLASRCSGEFWGITRTDLLGTDRLNEDLRGFEDTLWFKINERAKRYYLHQALRIYHTEGDDRMTKAVHSVEQTAHHYKSLLKEEHYLKTMKENLPVVFTRDCLRAVIFLKANNQKGNAAFYYDYVLNSKGFYLSKLITLLAFNTNGNLLNFLIRTRNSLKKKKH